MKHIGWLLLVLQNINLQPLIINWPLSGIFLFAQGGVQEVGGGSVLCQELGSGLAGSEVEEGLQSGCIPHH